jgi:hypothetical protein
MIRYRPAAPLDTLHDKPISCWKGSSQENSLIWTRGFLHGPQWSYFVSGPKPCGVVTGVSFRPGAAGSVLGLPLTELTDRHNTTDVCAHRISDDKARWTLDSSVGRVSSAMPTWDGRELLC